MRRKGIVTKAGRIKSAGRKAGRAGFSGRKAGCFAVIGLILILSIVALSIGSLSVGSVFAAPAREDIAGEIQAESFALMDADTGQTLLCRDMDTPRKPASITKIMTALLAIESCPPDDPVSVSEAAVAANPGDGSSVGLKPGEIAPLDELLYAVMLESANEAANAVAEHVSGTMERFALRMTERAIEIGARNTNFANANGLNNDDHYTSAYDMALITREAIKHQRFLDIWGSYQHRLAPTNLQSEERVFNNKNRLLRQSSMPYDGILGGKTGYTKASMNTLVEVARRDGRTLICVLLLGPSAMANFQDAVKLLDYGFNEFTKIVRADEEYETQYSFLLHDSLTLEDIDINQSPPVENEDGSHTVDVIISAPEEYKELMYPGVASFSMTSAPTPPPVAPEPERWFRGASDLVERISPFERAKTPVRASSFFLMMSKLPVWLALSINILSSAMIALFVLAVIFRTRRRLRRKRRRQRRFLMEARARHGLRNG